MHKTNNYLLFLLFFVSAACGNAIEPITVTEQSYVEADINEVFWEAKTFSLAESQRVVSPLETDKLLTRFILSAHTDDQEQINISFDVANADEFVGRYDATYKINGGLAEMTSFNKNGGGYEVYALAPQDSTANIRIRRHSANSRVVSGTFEGVLINRRNPQDRLRISNGTFSNLNYPK